MKRIFGLLTALMPLCTLAACGGTESRRKLIRYGGRI